MTSYWDQARQTSSDPLEDPAIPFVHTVQTVGFGWPRVELEPNLLSTALILRPKTQIAKTAGCSTRTIQRRQLEYGIHTPGPGHSQQARQVGGDNEVSDEELDQCLAIIMQDFPSFGQRLTTASLRANRVIVSEGRMRDSLTRVSGVPGVFGG